MGLKVGEKAPGFALFDQDRHLRTLAEFLNKKIVLVFYPGAFTSVCTNEMCTFQNSLIKFNNLKIQVIGISVDSPFANKAFANLNNLQFPLLSDYKREVSQNYGGLYYDFAGLKGYSACKRAVYIIDENGIIIYAWVSEDPAVEPNYETIENIASKK